MKGRTHDRTITLAIFLLIVVLCFVGKCQAQKIKACECENRTIKIQTPDDKPCRWLVINHDLNTITITGERVFVFVFNSCARQKKVEYYRLKIDGHGVLINHPRKAELRLLKDEKIITVEIAYE